MPRPIEMNAHQALASERELLISLFGQDNQLHIANGHIDGQNDVPSSAALLNRVLEGVCRPLKVRKVTVAATTSNC